MKERLEPLTEVERYELRAGLPYHFDLARRSFFKVLGGGIAIVCLVREALAQETKGKRRGSSGGGQRRPQDISAWLHIGEDGQVTVYTGKVEVGQNIRTSLTQAVAEELRAPVSSIHLLMADTDLVPYDGGTAGSRTTPDMFPQLRRVAAAARELLVDMAAGHWEVDPSNLVVADGKVTHPDTNRSVGFGELTKGQKLMKTVSDSSPLTPAGQWKVCGTPVSKVDGREFVTGRHQYASDIRRPDMLFGRVLRPAAFGASLVSLETKEAEAIPGVTVVRDGDFVGVAAPTDQIAQHALTALEAGWKTSPQLSDKELFDSLKKQTSEGRSSKGGGGSGGASTNKAGSLEEGLAAADKKLKATYTIAYIAHTPLEPRAAVAEWKEGKLTVWTGTQRPFGVRGELAQTFRLAEDKVRVIVPDTGAGYGGKHTGEAAIEAARLAKAAGKPVKLVWTREEEFTWAYFRPAGVIEITSGARNDGRITAWEFHNYNSGASAIRPLYDIPHQNTQFHSARAPLRQGSYRSLAATANHFARESHMDDLAHAVGMDPLEFRLKNLKDARLHAVLDAAAKAFGWGKTKAAPDRGFGLGCGSDKGSYVATCAEVAVDRAAGKIKVVRAVSAFECGAIVNPDHLKNQVEGALTMGLGGALYEAIKFENGKILNPRLSEYRVPRFSDAPVIEVVLVDRKDLPSLGAGETPIVGIAPAVGNAIFNATGIRLRSLPMIPNGLRV